MQENRSYPLGFFGSGGDYFKILIVNTILSILTLGLYYPWAKEKRLKYLYSKSTFDETPFVFSGTGKEMFKGFIKAVGILILIYGIFLSLLFNGHTATALLFFYAALMGLSQSLCTAPTATEWQRQAGEEFALVTMEIEMNFWEYS
jgi:uncharacterized membrane protein YjgN (DUF898 family)